MLKLFFIACLGGEREGCNKRVGSAKYPGAKQQVSSPLCFVVFVFVIVIVFVIAAVFVFDIVVICNVTKKSGEC